jgi:ABC-2 type transport system ATP-binding protein
MIGFYKASKGSILYHNKKILKDQKAVQEDFGFVTQAGSFYRDLSVRENLRYFGRLYGLGKKTIDNRSSELLKFLDMLEAFDVLARDLSTGMQRRLDVACALIHKPKVLILDEPTEDLDPVLRKELLALLKKIKDEGTTIILTSHMLDEVESVCDKVCVLHQGKVLTSGTPNKIKDIYSSNLEIHLKTHPGKYNLISKKLGNSGIKQIVDKGHKLVIYTPVPEKVLKNILNILPRVKEKLMDVEVEKPSLEEVFESMTGRKR